jgi:molybdopterin-binding protein
VIELTKDAVQELTLKPGCGLWLFVKTSSITVYG